MAADGGDGALKANPQKISSARKMKLAGAPETRVVRRKASASSAQRVA